MQRAFLLLVPWTFVAVLLFVAGAATVGQLLMLMPKSGPIGGLMGGVMAVVLGTYFLQAMWARDISGNFMIGLSGIGAAVGVNALALTSMFVPELKPWFAPAVELAQGWIPPVLLIVGLGFYFLSHKKPSP